MEYTKLGNTGLDVSRICLGCMGFGDTENWIHKWVLEEEESRSVIKKALVELNGKPFKKFALQREKWAIETSYTFPGAIQYFGPSEICDQPSKTLMLEQK